MFDLKQAYSLTQSSVKSTCCQHEDLTLILDQDPLSTLALVIDSIHRNKPFLVIPTNENPHQCLRDLFSQTPPDLIKSSQIILRSSGTSGRSKFIFRTLSSWLNSFRAHQEAFSLTPSQRVLVLGPMTYSANLYHALLSLYLGQEVWVYQSAFVGHLIKKIPPLGVDVIYTVPSRLKSLSAWLGTQDRATLITVGERLTQTHINQVPPHLIKRAFHYYGASELGQLAFATYQDISEKPGLLGMPFPGVQFRVSSHNHIVLNKGFPALTFEPPSTVYDLGYIKDKALYFIGRKDDQVNVYGKKISLVPVRDLLNQVASLESYYIETLVIRGKEAYTLHLLMPVPLSATTLEAICHILKPHEVVYHTQVPTNASGKYQWTTLIKEART